MPRRPARCWRATASGMTPISSSATPSRTGTSRQVWRSVADDRATCSVAARVEVARDAQKTDGEQSLKGLLLARSAVINAKPELEIFADDVKCAHGATRRRARRARALLPRKPRRHARRGEGPAHPRLRRRRARPDRRGGRARGLLRRRGRLVRLMDMAASTRPLDWRADFPAIPEGWAYLDSAATAQKPQGGDRRDHAGLCRDLCDRPSRRLPALGRDDGGVRGLAAARRPLHRRRQRRRRSSSSAARPRGSTSSRKAGAATISSPATGCCSRRSSIIPTSCPGSSPAPRSTSCR